MQTKSPTDMTRMTSPDIARALTRGMTTAIVVLGAQEQHGAHLPLVTDSLWGERLAGVVAERLGNALVAPVVPVGVSPEHMSFAGTITLRPETFAAVVDDYVTSLAHHGFKWIVLLPSHGGNFDPLDAELPRLRARHPDITVIAHTDLLGLVDAAAAVAGAAGVSPEEAGAHAGEWETSMVLALEPDLVHLERGEAGYLGPLVPVFDQINREGMESVTPNGVLGDPAKASASHGDAYLARMAELLVEHVRSVVDDRSSAVVADT